MKPLALLLLAAVCFAADEVPSWVREAAARTAPQYPAKTPYVILFGEEQLTVEPDGRQITHERAAVRILQERGTMPHAVQHYNTRSDRVRSFQGWVLPPVGRPKLLGKNAVVDVAAVARYTTYDESRMQSIDPGNLASGTVFAWETIVEERTVFTQDTYPFQGTAPVLVSRYVLTLPPGWEVSAVTLNHPPIQPQISGSTYTWELRDLPWVEEEENSPDWDSLSPRLGLSFFPGPGAPREMRPLRDWSAVSAWFSELSDPAAALTDPVRSKAVQLTASAKTDWEKIRSVATFVQKTNYVEVLTNLSRGGGFTPRPAAQSLERNYGDCKDKAALMRALLKAVGIDSYELDISADDRYFVRPEWPSAYQFNHAIVAIRAPAGIDAPALLDHPRLGRLLIFDPTNTTTPLGDLPHDEQGSQALVLAGKAGELIAVPFLPARRESTVLADMKPDGSLAAHAQWQYFGQSAAHLRRLVQSQKPEDLKKIYEHWLARGLGGVAIGRMEPNDRMDEGRLDLQLDFTVRQFGQMMQERLLVVTPGALASSAGYALPAKERKLPVSLEADRYQDTATLTVPMQFRIDEIPDPVRIESSYGAYSADWKARGNVVEFRQALEVKPMLVPASDYSKVREFFRKVDSARTSAVILVKQ